jgi:uroporphyrin-III C-methyltransferase
MRKGKSASDVMAVSGKVILVGAGPGDPELMTVKAVRALESADVVVYDRLVSPEILALAPRGSARISVGKAPRNHSLPQDEINALLVRLALGGRTVVRLKGGDPFIFGRGAEEALELVKHNIPFEVVPGITSAQGCAAASGVPLTHRGLATSVRYITGHCRDDIDLDYDWQGLADTDTTLVVYMGLASVPLIAGKLQQHGLPGETPVLVVNNGTTSDQRRGLTRLDALERMVAESEFEGPVLFVIGKVASLASELGGMDAQQGDKSPALTA